MSIKIKICFLLLVIPTVAFSQQNIAGDWYCVYSKNISDGWGYITTETKNNKDVDEPLMSFTIDSVVGRSIIMGSVSYKVPYAVSNFDSIKLNGDFWRYKLALVGDTIFCTTYHSYKKYVKVNYNFYEPVKRGNFEKFYNYSCGNTYKVTKKNLDKNTVEVMNKLHSFLIDSTQVDSVGEYYYVKKDYYCILKSIKDVFDEDFFSLSYYNNRLLMFTARYGLVVVKKIKKKRIITCSFEDNGRYEIIFDKIKKKSPADALL